MKMSDENEEMRPEYDFSGGVRGKHYKAYRAGHTVTVHRIDGTDKVQHFEGEPCMVELAPDVRVYFPDAESVNRALRGLIQLIPKQTESE